MKLKHLVITAAIALPLFLLVLAGLRFWALNKTLFSTRQVPVIQCLGDCPTVTYATKGKARSKAKGQGKEAQGKQDDNADNLVLDVSRPSLIELEEPKQFNLSPFDVNGQGIGAGNASHIYDLARDGGFCLPCCVHADSGGSSNSGGSVSSGSNIYGVVGNTVEGLGQGESHQVGEASSILSLGFGLGGIGLAWWLASTGKKGRS